MILIINHTLIDGFHVMILLGVVIDVCCAGICLCEFMYTAGYKSKSKVVYLYGGVEGPPHIFFRHHAISYG